MRAVRIGIIGNFGIGNFGNHETLKSMLQFLRKEYPEAILTCVCSIPEKVKTDFQIAALPLLCPSPTSPYVRKLRKPISVLYAVLIARKFDILIFPGTGILNDFHASPFGLPFTIFMWCLAAKLCGVKIAFVSIGAGPAHQQLTRWFIKHAASMAQYRSYRNQFSKNFLKGLGLNANNDRVYPDLAFRLTIPSFEEQQARDPNHLTVGFGVMDYHGWQGHLRTDDRIYEEYIGKLRDFVLWLLNQGYRIRLLMGDENDRKSVDDLRQAVLVHKPLSPPGTLISEPAHSYQEVLPQMAGADIIIASRFHHLVFAAMLGKLTISTGYSDYHAELMKDLGLEAFCQHSERLDVDSLTRQFQELISKRDHYEAIIRDAVASCRMKLVEQDKLLNDLIRRSWLPPKNRVTLRQLGSRSPAGEID